MRGRAAFLAACALAALAPLMPRPRPDPGVVPAFPGWPGEALAGAAPEPLDPAEARILAAFPGRLARFRSPGREAVVAWVHAPTRLLHPADDCFRGLGYVITPLPLERDGAGNLWSVRRAVRGAERLRVRERIVAADGRGFSDVSSWYWAALLGTSPGPWWHWRVAEAEPATSPGPRPPGGPPP